MEDKWRNVPGFEGKYQINIDTPQGRGRSLDYNHTGKVRELTNKPNKQGRLYWTLSKDGSQVTQQAAVWIAITYPELVENEYFDGAEIDHIDTDPMNNHPSNLRWVDRVGQMNNPLTKQHISESAKGRIISEETREKMSEGHLNHPDMSKSVIQFSLNNEILHFYPSLMQSSRETGIDYRNISACCLGKVKSAGGFIWKYAE